MSVTLRLYDGQGAFLTMLPLLGSVDIQDVLNDEGAGTVAYTASGPGVKELLSLTDGMIGVSLDGEEVFTFLPEDDQDDEADDAGLARDITVAGPGTLGVLARGVVLPSDGIGAVPAIHKFVNATAGGIMLHLIEQMKRLGYLPQVTTSFTALRDSAGQEWDTNVDIEYDAGKDLLAVVKDLAAQGVCDLRMRRFRLDLFNPNKTLGQDKPGVFVRRAHAESAPRKRSRRELRTDYLVVGDEGANMLRFDEDARARYGKRIGFIGQGNTITASALSRAGDEALKESSRPSTGYTLGLRLEVPSCPRPYVDFQLGDSIRSDFATRPEDGGYEPLRVRSIATTFGRDGARKVSLEVNDRFTEAILDLARKVDGIRHGKTSGTSAPPSAGQDAQDAITPPSPQEVRARTQVSYSPEGQTTASVAVSWPPVIIPDLAHYEVRYLLEAEQLPPDPDPFPEAPADPAAEDPNIVDPGVDPAPPVEPEPPPENVLTPTFVENFARRDSTGIGNLWTQVGGDYNLVSEQAVTRAGSAALLRSYGRKNVDVEAVITSDLGTPGVLAWADSNRGVSSGYFAQVNPQSTGTNVTLRRAGVQVGAVHFGPANNRIGAGARTITLSIRGPIISVLVDGTLALTYTEAAPATAPTGVWLGAASGVAALTSIDSIIVSELLPPPAGATP